MPPELLIEFTMNLMGSFDPMLYRIDRAQVPDAFAFSINDQQIGPAHPGFGAPNARRNAGAQTHPVDGGEDDAADSGLARRHEFHPDGADLAT